MKCHYEILGIEKDAEDDEIKKSYRKLALKWHPDKNPDQTEECTRQFHLIQQAYEVLIDPQERAWYDNHREAILRGGLGHGGDYEDKCLNVYQYFNTTCYSGYGNDEKGFYAVYGEVFNTIAAEDAEFMDDKDSDYEVPGFGQSDSDYEEVVRAFYAYWESYCTTRSFVWVEKYDTREAPNRQIRRLMEQDNKKLRDKAKKERNEEVRALVGFVRKRDKRVQAYKKKLEERVEEIARQTEKKKKKQREEKLKRLENYEDTGWSAMSALEQDLSALEAKVAAQFQEGNEEEGGSDGSSGLEEEEEEYFDDLYCVACNKSFKTDKAMVNHEKSKKHRENIIILQQQMLEEEEEGEGEGETVNDTVGVKHGTQSTDLIDDNIELLDGEDIADLDLSDDGDFQDDQPQQKSKLSKKQKKKRKQRQKQEMVEDDNKTDNLAGLDVNTPDKIKENSSGLPEETGHVEPTEAIASDIADASVKTDTVEGTIEGIAETTGAENVTKKTSNVPKKPNKQKGDFLCNKCRQKFQTRNKLFDHLKVSGHAMHLPPTQPVQQETSKSKKKKKGKT